MKQMFGNDTHTHKGYWTASGVCARACAGAHKSMQVHWLYNNQIQSAESNVTFFPRRRFFNDTLMVGLCLSRHIKGLLFPLSSDTGYHEKIYKLTNTPI